MHFRGIASQDCIIYYPYHVKRMRRWQIHSVPLRVKEGCYRARFFFFEYHRADKFLLRYLCTMHEHTQESNYFWGHGTPVIL